MFSKVTADSYGGLNRNCRLTKYRSARRAAAGSCVEWRKCRTQQSACCNGYLFGRPAIASEPEKVYINSLYLFEVGGCSQRTDQRCPPLIGLNNFHYIRQKKQGYYLMDAEEQTSFLWLYPEGTDLSTISKRIGIAGYYAKAGWMLCFRDLCRHWILKHRTLGASMSRKLPLSYWAHDIWHWPYLGPAYAFLFRVFRFVAIVNGEPRQDGSNYW